MKENERDNSSDLQFLCALMTLLVGMLLRRNGSFDDYLEQVLNVPNNYFPSDDPLFYIIRKDFIEGIVAGTELLMVLILGLVTWKKFRLFGLMTIIFSVVFLLRTIITMSMIYFNCDRLMDIENASSNWETLKEYRSDISMVSWGFLLVLFFLIIGISRKYKGKNELEDSAE